VAASVTPVWAISRVCTEQQPVLPKPRTKAAAEMESELEQLVAASCPAGRSAACAEQAAHSERENSSRDVKLSEAAGGGERHARQGDQLGARRAAACATQAKSRAKAAAGMESELKPLAVASVTPVWAISCVRAEQQPFLPWPRTKAAAEMESELKLLAAASVVPGRAITCVEMESELELLAAVSVLPGRAISCVSRAAACASQAEGKSSGRDGERAEAAGGERHARQGDQLRTRRAAARAAQAENESSG